MTRLFIPGVTRDDEEPAYSCDVCGLMFYEEEREKWQRHVGECARRNIAEIREAALKKRMPVFDPENWDPEVDEHMRKVGQRMIRERRLTVRKNERAGFD